MSIKSKLALLTGMALALNAETMSGSGHNGGSHWVKSNMTPKQKKNRKKAKAASKARKRNR